MSALLVLAIIPPELAALASLYAATYPLLNMAAR